MRRLIMFAYLAASFALLLGGIACSKKSPTAPPDTQGPTTVSDLRILSADTASVRLGWTAPSDNGNAATAYELRMAVDSSATWSAMTPVAGLPAPRAPGQAESFRVGGLAMATSYSFLLRSRDAKGNESASSNRAQGATTESTVGADLAVSTAEAGIWYSRNAGRTWHQAAVSNQRASFGILAATPQNRAVLYAASSWASFGDYPFLYRSTDGGANWSPMNASFVQNGAVASIAVATTSSNTIYVGVRGQCLEYHNNCAGEAGGAYRSSDGGVSWQNISTGLPILGGGFGTVAVYSIAVDPTNAANISAGTYDGNLDTGFFYSTNGGSSWARTSGNPPDHYVYTVAIDPSNPRRILVSTGITGGLYLAEGGPASQFTRVWASGGNQPIVFDPANPQVVYTASTRSLDGGRTWAPITLPPGASPVSPGQTQMAVDPATHHVYAAGTGGLYRSVDQGSTWTEVRSFSGGCTGLVVTP